MKKALILIFLFFGIGVVTGLLIKDFPYLTIDSKVSVGDIGNFILALIVAIVIPILLNDWLDNERHLKNFIIEEIQKCIVSIEPIKAQINKCYLDDSTTMHDKKEIRFQFKEADIRFYCLKEQLILSFNKKGSKIYSEIFAEYMKYWKDVTDGELMNDQFTIDEGFFRKHNQAYAYFEAFLKKCIHRINKF